MKHLRMRPVQAALLSLLLAGGMAFAATGSSSKTASARPAPSVSQEAQQIFRDEMAFCASGASDQGRRVCEQEARAAYVQNLRGVLGKAGSDYRNNARQRCEALAPDERGVCLMRLARPGLADQVLVVPGSERPLESTTPPRE